MFHGKKLVRHHFIYTSTASGFVSLSRGHPREAGAGRLAPRAERLLAADADRRGALLRGNPDVLPRGVAGHRG